MENNFKKNVQKLLESGDYSKAEEYLNSLLAQDPENQELKLLHGACRLLQGDRDAFTRTRAEVAKTPGAASGMLQSLTRIGQMLLLPSLCFVGASCDKISSITDDPKCVYAGPEMMVPAVTDKENDLTDDNQASEENTKDAKDEKQQKYICTACGKIYDHKAKFCSECGAELKEYDGKAPDNKVQPQANLSTNPQATFTVVKPVPQTPTLSKAEAIDALSALKEHEKVKSQPYLNNTFKKLSAEAEILSSLENKNATQKRKALQAILSQRLDSQEGQLKEMGMRCVYAGPGYMEQARAKLQQEQNSMRDGINLTKQQLEDIKQDDKKCQAVYEAEWQRLILAIEKLKFNVENF